MVQFLSPAPQIPLTIQPLCDLQNHDPKQRLAFILVLVILAQILSRKSALGVLPLVDLALPAFVGPRGGTEAD
jgi:hypothetical protein